ncbi:Protein of unknown function (DUF3616) [Rhizobium leguminosarum bv. trifolii WSM597]|uniref:DUF3616 domain-containing protein n=1 Tax=Rhizobium leguminosarum bv. trifolii WSM597 TaxID=754764 RepID=J0GW49_RHILT|nr:DUF3616 domain-containing protein [Rhizobium leguminosarum]EJB01763.1 Protein of unknown function (DUF3616) [Rhizobium leguminosarum bv. trifolii WSM597]
MSGANEPRKFWSALIVTCLSAGIGWSGGTPGHAAESQLWKVSGKLIGKPENLEGSDSKKSKDVSGIACTATSSYPRVCLVADDETQGVQIVILEDGKLIAGDFVRLIDDTFDNTALELDAEGVAFADGFFYVIGSHGRPRHEDGKEDTAEIDARVKASSRIFRIRFASNAIDTKTGKLLDQPELTSSRLLTSISRLMPELQPFVDKPLEENGLTIEGVAVRDGTMYAGLRGPILTDHRAAILSVPLGVLFDKKTGDATLLRPELEVDSFGYPRGVRDLLAFEGKLLVLAGPENDPPKGHRIQLGDYAIFSYDQKAHKLLDLKGYGSEIKPEALLPLSAIDGKLCALLLFDGPEEGQPTPIGVELN